MAYLFALGAGLCYAVASVFQHRVVAGAPSDLSLRPGLILVVIRHPIWFAGIGLDVGAYLLEALALANGSIVLVQTLLVSGLLFALPLSVIGRADRPGRGDWFAAAAVAVGIAVFLGVGDPQGGSTNATAIEWVSAGSLCVTVMLAMIVLTRNAQPHYRALGLAVATGASYALTAALTKQVVGLIDERGFLNLFGSWPVYTLAFFAVGGLILNQSAFHAGPLGASLPALAVTTPMLSAVLGIALFEEEFSASGLLEYSIAIAAVVVMFFGVIRLARSPFVSGGPDGHPPITPAAP